MAAEAIREFWKWVIENRTKLDALKKPDEPFWDQVLAALKRVDPRLFFELSSPSPDREFVVTADGEVDAFPLVDALVAAAPSLSGWQFIALKPPMGFAFSMNYEGIEFDPRTMWFLPLQSSVRPRDLGLRIGVPNLISGSEREATSALFHILDTALGERVASRLAHVQPVPLPSNPEASGFIELPELTEFMEWHARTNTVH